MEIYVIHAHPVGEDSEVFWISVGKTREDAMERLKTAVDEAWSDMDDTIDLSNSQEWTLSEYTETL